MNVKRRFIDMPFGQIHYRQAGVADAPKLMLLHASPGSSKQLELLIDELSQSFLVVAPDTLGNGDSTPPIQEQPEIADYGAAMFAFTKALGWSRMHLYGTHTGARIATWMALNDVAQVDRLILDGFGLYTPESIDEILKVYAPSIEPDQQGIYALQAWQLCRDQYIWFPWFSKKTTDRVPHDLPDAEFLHSKFVEVLKEIRTYHKSYKAAFRYSMREHVPHLKNRTLITCADNDLVRKDYDQAKALLGAAEHFTTPGVRTPEAATVTAKRFSQFLLS